MIKDDQIAYLQLVHQVLPLKISVAYPFRPATHVDHLGRPAARGQEDLRLRIRRGDLGDSIGFSIGFDPHILVDDGKTYGYSGKRLAKHIHHILWPGRGCCTGKCFLMTAQGQCSRHFGMSADCPNYWQNLCPKNKTLNLRSLAALRRQHRLLFKLCAVQRLTCSVLKLGVLFLRLYSPQFCLTECL